jgi:riboflavin biosynthesis pyrimidine reductase
MAKKQPAQKKPRRTRPDITLFLSLSVDGRITSHDSDTFDPDPTWKNTPGIRGILQQFYDFASPGMTVLTTGQFMQKLGVNDRDNPPKKESFSMIVLDPDADLTPKGLKYLSQNVQNLYLICLSSHPIHKSRVASCELPIIIPYTHEIDLNHAFAKLFRTHKVKDIFIHSIAPINADLLEAGLIDHLSIVVSPLLVGGHGTPTLDNADVFTVRPLKLESVKPFAQNFVSLRYQVIN